MANHLDTNISYNYFYKKNNISILFDFNPGSLSILFGSLSGIYAFFSGLRSVVYYENLNIETPLGIKILFLTSAIISVQLLISFMYFDATQRPLIRQLKSLKMNRINN